MSSLDSFLDWWLTASPIQRYPIESFVISITLFCISLWALGSRINQDIANQLAIPLIKEFKDMGFHQIPAFNTLSHPIRRGYTALPPLDGDKKATKEQKKEIKVTSPSDSQNELETVPQAQPGIKSTPYPAISQLKHYLWAENYSSYQLYASGHGFFKGIRSHIQLVPRHDILMQIGSLLRIVPNKDIMTIQIAFKYLEPFFWSFSHDPVLAAQVRKDHNLRKEVVSRIESGNNEGGDKKQGQKDQKVEDSPLDDKNENGQNDPSHQDSSLLGGSKSHSDLIDQDGDGNGVGSSDDDDDDDSEPLLGGSFAPKSSTSPPNLAQAMARSGHKGQRAQKKSQNTQKVPEVISNLVDFGGLKMTHALVSPESDYVITTDSADLVKNPRSMPCDGATVKFFADLAQNTQNAFSFLSLEISDQSDSYDVVKFTDIPIVAEGAGDDVPFEEESALVTLQIQFNFENVPRVESETKSTESSPQSSSQASDQDYNNQEFVNKWMTQIGATLFAIAYGLMTYRLPPHVHRNNLKIRDTFDLDVNLRADGPPKEQKKAKVQEREAREGISNSIIGSGNLKKRVVTKR